MKNNQININNNEIKMQENDFIVSKTNAKGIITYCNEIFMHMSDYSENELLGQNHNIIRHPDMPKAAFKLAWDFISSGKEFFAYVKNLRKDGSYYWVFANITADYDSNGKIIGYTSVRRKPNDQAIKTIIPIYSKMLELEKSSGLKASVSYLLKFLEDNNVQYNDLILSLQGDL